MEVRASQAPWTPTGWRLRPGEQVTWLACGESRLGGPAGTPLGPSLQLRARVGRSAPFGGTRATHTFTAEDAGELVLASIHPDEIRPGDHAVVSDLLPRLLMSGGFLVVLVRWAPGVDVCESLCAVVDRSGLCRAEAQRLRRPPAPPRGWREHAVIGPSETHRGGCGQISSETAGDVGIICFDVSVPLTASLRLRWEWSVERLPSERPEDTLLTHDYLGIAVEFDDGRDLSWHWSAGLPEGYSYRCPLPHWRHRETHVVVRSGDTGLAGWVQQERRVAADHASAIGGRTPSAVVAVWLIGTSVMQRRRGACRWRRVELVDGDRVLGVL